MPSPPAAPMAELSLIVQPVTVRVAPTLLELLSAPPPALAPGLPPSASLPSKVLLLIVAEPVLARFRSIAPPDAKMKEGLTMGSLGPTAMASLPSKVLLLTVSVPDEDDMSSMAPPNPPPAGVPRASLPVNSQLVILTAAPPSIRMPPPALAWLPLTVQMASVAVPLSWMPPPTLAELPLTVQMVSVAVLSPLTYRPPPYGAELPLTLQSRSLVVPTPWTYRPPPPPKTTELPLMVQLVSVAMLKLSMPPPSPLTKLPLTLQSVSVAVPEFIRPPPSLLAELPLMVQLVNVAMPL